MFRSKVQALFYLQIKSFVLIFYLTFTYPRVLFPLSRSHNTRLQVLRSHAFDSILIQRELYILLAKFMSRRL